MADVMVTGRMDAHKKARGAAILQQSGVTASQAINLLYDKLIAEGNANFLFAEAPTSEETWSRAALFVDSLSAPASSRFDTMSKAEIRAERLRDKGLL